MQMRRNSSGLAMELHLVCARPSIWDATKPPLKLHHIEVSNHAGKPNSPFSAKIHPFSAQTTRSWQKTPVLGKIRPFAVQSSRYPHAIFSIEINVAKEE